MTMLVSLKDKMGKAVMRRLITESQEALSTSATKSFRDRLSLE